MKRILTNGLAFLGAALLISQLSSCSSDNAVVDSSLGENVPVKNVTAAPTNLAASEIEEHSFRVTWDGGDATHFIVETSTVADFSMPDSIVVSDAISETKYYVRNVIEEKDYYVRIKATAFGEKESEYSEILNVTTLAPYRPTLSVPENFTILSVKGFEIGLSWSKGEAERWIVQYGTDSLLDVCEETDQLTEPTAVISNLTSLTDYYFRVKALAKGWKDSEYTSIIHAKTTDLTPAPLPTNLALSEIDTTSMKLTWDANGATSWMVCYSVNADFSDPYRLSDEISTNEFVATGLSINTKYYFRVRAYKEHYKTSAWTAEGNPSAATLSAPVNVDSLTLEAYELTKTSFMLTWGSSNADFHSLEISKDAAFGTLESVSIDSVSAKNGSTALIDSLPADGAKYYVRLKAQKEGYNTSYSDVLEVSLLDPSAIELTTPSNVKIDKGTLGDTKNTFEVTWDANAQTSDVVYELRIDTTLAAIAADIAPRGTSTPSWQLWGEKVTTNSYLMEKAQPNLKFFAQVRATKEGCVSSDWSTPVIYQMPTGGRAFPTPDDNISYLLRDLGENDVVYLTLDRSEGTYRVNSTVDIDHSWAIHAAPGIRPEVYINNPIRWKGHNVKKISYKGLYVTSNNRGMFHGVPTAGADDSQLFTVGTMEMVDCWYNGNNGSSGTRFFYCWSTSVTVGTKNLGVVDSLIVDNSIVYNVAPTQNGLVWCGNGNGRSRAMANNVIVRNSTFTESKRGIIAFNHCTGDSKILVENCTFADNATEGSNLGAFMSSIVSSTSTHAFNVEAVVKNSIWVNGNTAGKTPFVYMHKSYTGTCNVDCKGSYFVDKSGQQPLNNKANVTELTVIPQATTAQVFAAPNHKDAIGSGVSYKIIHPDIPVTVGDPRWNK